MGQFLFDLGQKVVIRCSGEQGEVVGRAQYLRDDNLYLVEYADATGVATQRWWREPALEKAESLEALQ